ncbi:unnamed protein product [Closterium sp. Yama58-4]|nr:unnamed protein product [Closterium sp. Yama58-4]
MSQSTDMPPLKSSSSSALGATTANDGYDVTTLQGDNALDAGMIFLGGHRTRPNWSPQEDLILLQHVARHGTRNWGSLQASGLLPLRDQKACCNRFILLKKRCIKDKRSLSHLLHRAKESVVTPETSTQLNQIASSSSFAAPSFSSQLQLPALSGGSLGLNSNSRPSFKSGSPTSASGIAAATAAFNAPSATASPTAARSPVSLVQQQQHTEQQQQLKIQQALAGSPYLQQPAVNTSNAALGGGNVSGVPLLQMPALNPSMPLSMSVQLANLNSSFTALLTSSVSVNHRLASMAAPAPVISHTWRPQGNAKCLQEALFSDSVNEESREMQIQQQQVFHSQQQALNLKLQQQQQQEQISHDNLSEVTRQLAQQEQGNQQVMSQRPDVMLLEAFSSARGISNESLHNSLNEPQQMLDAGSGDPWAALNTTEDARLANIVSSGSLEAVVAGNGRVTEFPLTAFDDEKPVGAADFQSEEAMFSSLTHNGMFADMPSSFSESDMLQAIHAEMEMLSSIVNASYSSLVKQVTDHSLPVQLRLDIRNYVVSFLATKGPKAESFVTASLVQLLCRISKLGWYDDERFRDIVDECTKFLAQGTAEHFFLGLKIFNQLVAEMNQPSPGRSLTFHRKTACSFRDLALFAIFQISLTSLRQLQSDADDKLRAEAVSLALRCLSFDFVGTSLDESSEELGTIQVPSSWRAVLEDTATMQLFFDYYAATKPPLSNQSLECLVRLASVRRSLFTGEAERLKFLSHLMNGSTEILRSKQGLSQHDNYHEYCRLLGRLKTNYQLAELVNADNYAEWVQLVAEFTITSLQSWQWASGSVYFLLGLWSRLVSSMAYTKSDCPSLLDNFVPQITEAYITSRLDSVQAVLQNNLSEDPLDNDEQLQDQLDNLPYLCRFQFDRTSKFIISHLEPIMQSYTEAARWQPAVAASSTSQVALQVMESQLTWIVHIIGAIVRGRLSSSSGDSQELIDGELAARVFQLIQVTDTGLHAQRYDERSKQRLDLAVLSFFQNFRRVYVGDQAMHASKVDTVEPCLGAKAMRASKVDTVEPCLGAKVTAGRYRSLYVGDQAMHASKVDTIEPCLGAKILYARLADLLGLQDHLMVLNVIVAKIATNLKCYTKSEDVIEQTLNLFQELAGGYMSGKLLLKLDSVNFILANHTSEHFPFLDEPSSTRNRTIFYFTLTRLLFMEDSPQKFKAFVAPLQLVSTILYRIVHSHASALHGGLASEVQSIRRPSAAGEHHIVFVKLESMPDASFRTEPVKFALIGLFRDLRGITMATNSRRTFGLLFDWLYPAHMPLILRTAQFCSDTPAVTTPLLKFFAEFVVNKTQRLTFDSSSPNGILLFREASKLVVMYGKHALAMPTGPHPYTAKYKGVWIALTVLTRALAGNYVNFGVMELYGDTALPDALDVALKLCLSIPLPEIMAFRKLARAYFAFLEVLCHNHTLVIINLPTATFSHLVGSLDTGLKCLDVSISSQCASAVDNLAAYYFNNVTAGDAPSSPAALTIAQHLAECPTLFPEILKTLFEIVLFEDCANQWSLSRPMLSLILVNEQLYNDLKLQILSSQPSDQRPRIAECFDKLMADVGRNLDPKNRDKFTQNLTIFRHDFRAK